MVGASSRLFILLTTPLYLFYHRPSALLLLARRHSHSLTSPLPPLSAVPYRILPLSRTNSIFAIKSSQNFHAQTACNALPENNHKPADDYFVPPPHPWPEWSRLLEYLSVSGYFNGNTNIEDEFVAKEMEFVAAARSCLAFARDRPDILGWLPVNDIQVLIDDGTPFLFKSAPETERRMRFFLQAEESKEVGTVDLMKYILSYASNPIIYPERNIKEATESSVRNLIRDIINLSGTGPARQFQAVGRHEQTSRNHGQSIRMKRGEGDWICPKCNFRNFRRNTECLECEELRPQRELTGEWHCPQCNFFNYRDNVVCFRCECTRPDEGPFPSSLGQANASSDGQPISSHYRNDYGDNDIFKGANENLETSVNHSLDQFPDSAYIKDVDEEDKSDRWFKKVAEVHDVPGLTTAISDKDFMPMRKGENRFVVSKKRDRPLTSTYERQQAMEQGGNSNFVPFVPFPPDYFVKKDNQQQPESTDSTVKTTNDTSESSNSATHDMNLVQTTRNHQTVSTSNLDSRSSIENRDPFSQNRYVNIFSTQININETRPEILNVGQQTEESQNVRSGWTGKSLEGSAVKEADPLDMSEEAKAERWFRRVAQIKDISELSQIPDEDFPSIMPMRKGVNRFVVSKRKTPLERRLTSPQYRKNLRIMSSDTVKNEGDDS